MERSRVKLEEHVDTRVIGSRPHSERAVQRRERIISTARRLFKENGFHATGMARVAQESGILIGQIYRDFASKEEIVAVIVEIDLAELLGEGDLRTAIAHGDIASAHEWIRNFVSGRTQRDSSDSFGLFAEIMAETSRNEKIAAITDMLFERLDAAIAQALELLAPGKHKAQARADLANAILTISGGVFQRRLTQRSTFDESWADFITQMVDREITRVMTA
jgi:AcrR family transcriptional regulator